MNRQNSERIDEQAHAIPSRESGRPKVKTKITSMKRAFILFWRGLTGIFSGVANWFTVILGMRDDSKYGKFLRRVVGSCFAFMMVVFATAAGSALCEFLYDTLKVDRYLDESYYDQQYLSRNTTYYSRYGEDGYLKTSDGKKTITGITWIAKPLGYDSLVCYSDGRKRGYFNMFTGKPVIKPKYRHAWIFSDGLASVDDDGWIKFIDATGKIVIDPKIPYRQDIDGYVFHDGRCIVHNDRLDRFGIIDKQGKWVLEPEYFSIQVKDSMWIIDNGYGKSVVDINMKSIIPYIKGKIWVNEKDITVVLDSHVMQQYNYQGELIEDFLINDVNYMTYNTDELRYTSTKTYDEEGNVTGETEDEEPTPMQNMARCRRYETEYGWYGLMSPDGKILTPPSYRSITAVGYDLYLCKNTDDGGILLNGRGEKIQP